MSDISICFCSSCGHHICITSRQTSQHARCERDLGDLHIAQRQDGEKHLEASAWGEGGQGRIWIRCCSWGHFEGSVAVLHTSKSPLCFLIDRRSSQAVALSILLPFPVTEGADVWHLTGQTLVLLMAGTEHWNTLKFRGEAGNLKVFNMNRKSVFT